MMIKKLGFGALVGCLVACGGAGGASTVFLTGSVTLTGATGGFTGSTATISNATASAVTGNLFAANGFGSYVKVQLPAGNLFAGMAFPASTSGAVVTYEESVPPKTWTSSAGVIRLSASDGYTLSGVKVSYPNFPAAEEVTLNGSLTGFQISMQGLSTANGTLEIPTAHNYDQVVGPAIAGTDRTFTFTKSTSVGNDVVVLTVPFAELPTVTGTVNKISAGNAVVSYKATALSTAVTNSSGYMAVEKTASGYSFTMLGFGSFSGLLKI